MRPATILFAALFLVSPARADAPAETARALIARHADAVVTLRLVVKERFSMPGFSGEESESVLETTGTVIQPDGLIVTALSATDPSHIYGQFSGIFGEDDGVKMETEVARIAILGDEATEVPAAIVLRDRDLDLAFIRPIAPRETPWPHIPLDAGAEAAQFDPVFAAHRMGKVANRLCTAAFARVLAVLRKPRTLYVLGDWIALGGPAFGEAGAALGIVAMRTLAAGGAPSGSGFGAMMQDDGNMAVVIVPAAQVLESAGQAPATPGTAATPQAAPSAETAP